MLPVDFAERSEAKNATASATSSGYTLRLSKLRSRYTDSSSSTRLLVLRRALLGPFALPDARAAQHRVGIDDIHANAERRAFERQASRQMQLGRLGRAVGRGARRGGQRVLRADEHDGAADALRLVSWNAWRAIRK